MRRIGLCLLRAACAFMAAALLCAAAPARAEQATVLRVAACELEGFLERGAQGDYSGYGVELLQRLTQYSGIQFEYVPCDSWEDTQRLLLSGEADIRMPATLPSQPSATLGYTSQSIMDTCFVMMALKERDDLFYGDIETFQHCTVAIVDSQLAKSGIADELPSIGALRLVEKESYDACVAALQSGEVDALITNIMDFQSDYKILARFHSVSNYITMTIGNPMLSKLDVALSRIKMDSPTFLLELYRKYYPDRNNIPLTKEETQYVDSLQSIRFDFGEGRGYLSRVENGEYVGIYPDVVRRLCATLGVACEFGPADDDTAAAVVDHDCDYVWAAQNGYTLTSSFMDANYVQLQRRNEADAPLRVAVPERNQYLVAYARQRYAPENVVVCANFRACLEALKNRQADTAIMNRHIAEYYLGEFRYSALTTVLLDETQKICLAVRGDSQGLLASALSKALSCVSTDALTQITLDNMAAKPAQSEWDLLLYQDPAHTLLFFGAVMLVAAAIVSLLVINRHKHRQNVQLAQAAREARSANEAKSQLLSTISHDMRAPLNGVMNFAELALQTSDAAEKNEFLSKISHSGNYLLNLINDTLDLSRMESGRIELHPEPTPLGRVAQNVLLTVEPEAKQKGLRLVWEDERSTRETVMLDVLRTQEIMMNLLTNAIKFTPAGGEVHIISETLHEDERGVRQRLTVRDTGVGIGEAFLPHIFEPYTQERSAEYAGTGLGLCIVKRLVDLMHGSIEVHSRPGHGTEFVIELEWEKAKMDDTSPEAIVRELRGKRVLLCEDHPLNAEIVRRILSKWEMEVATAENGLKGLEAFEASKPGNFSAVLMDVHMPVMDGVTAARRIRQLERADARAVPIIALTGEALDDETMREGLTEMDACLSKPVRQDLLVNTLRECIRKRAEEKA
ncbi:MAG: ATP-binding protein [Eubacteriales bacterium]|nr:ATP-binding protein [Eubacteriales bacterium]